MPVSSLSYSFCHSSCVPKILCHCQEWISHCVSMIGGLLSPIKSLYLLVKEKWWYLFQSALPFAEREGCLLNILVKYAN